MTLHQQWVAFLTIVTKEVRRFLRIWPQTLLPPAITMTLYFVIFGNLVGSRIGEMGGFDYMQYIVPGLIMMSVIQNSYGNVVSSFFSTKFQHSIEEMLVSPTGRIASKVIASVPELFDRPAMKVPEPGALDTMTAESTSTVASRSMGPAAGV